MIFCVATKISILVLEAQREASNSISFVWKFFRSRFAHQKFFSMAVFLMNRTFFKRYLILIYFFRIKDLKYGIISCVSLKVWMSDVIIKNVAKLSEGLIIRRRKWESIWKGYTNFFNTRQKRQKRFFHLLFYLNYLKNQKIDRNTICPSSNIERIIHLLQQNSTGIHNIILNWIFRCFNFLGKNISKIKGNTLGNLPTKEKDLLKEVIHIKHGQVYFYKLAKSDNGGIKINIFGCMPNYTSTSNIK